MKNTSMRFPHNANPAAVAVAAAQASFNQSSAAQLAQMQQSSGAKWHTPQQKQASSHSNNLSAMMGMSMSPPATNFINDSFKIPLRSPDTLRNNNNINNNQNHQSSSNTNGQNSTSFPIPLPNVTSSAPKTPSPSNQKDPQKEIDSIDMVCNESVVDLLATIAKLDSNGVQVVPEGRNKATSPQVHSSTSDSLDPNSISLNDKSLNQSKDDPNEDWCAVCMGES
jgi:tripartite motif-containing protein 33